MSQTTKKLPPHLQNIKDHVFIEAEAPRHVKNINDVDAFHALGIDNEWGIKKFLQNFQIDIQSIDEEERSMEMDVIGIDPAIANALRRILLAEVPTMAIEDCCVLQNNSVLQDEVLCHRLGLIPIACDPRIFNFVDEANSRYEHGQDPFNTLVFKLHIKCTENANALEKDPPHKKYINSTVTSGDIEWVPQPGQQQLLDRHQHAPIRMVHDDIIIAKLRPGQCIEVSMRAVKGIGRDHAKFSPVGTAAYRLLPKIEFAFDEARKLKHLKKRDAQYLQKVCPKNVFDIEEYKPGKWDMVARRPRDCSLCRACIMDESMNKSYGTMRVDPYGDAEKLRYDSFVKLKHVRQHFIFRIESIGQYPRVTDLFAEAVGVLKQKCQSLIDGVHEMQEKEDTQLVMDGQPNDEQDVRVQNVVLHEQHNEEEDGEEEDEDDGEGHVECTDGDDRMQDID